jgi:hypothetical protein
MYGLDSTSSGMAYSSRSGAVVAGLILIVGGFVFTKLLDLFGSNLSSQVGTAYLLFIYLAQGKSLFVI